jgi:hypothetical protein
MEKNYFETLSENRTEFVNRLAFDDELAKLMVNNNPSYKENVVTDADKSELIYTQIYPFPKVMEEVNEVKSYITMKFRYKKELGSNIFKAAQVIFYCFCHNTIIPTSYQTLRYDAMLSCVDRLINDTRNGTWLGKMTFDGMDDVIIDNKGNYVGIAISYRNSEFQ